MDNQPYTYSADIYSIAMIFYEIISGSEPFPTINTAVGLVRVVVDKKERPDLKPFASFIPPALISLITAMWSADPNSRPSAEETFEQITAISIAQKPSADLIEDTKKRALKYL